MTDPTQLQDGEEPSRLTAQLQASSLQPAEPTSAPMVSVAMTAYNSERWIAKALESVLAQQTDFPFEIVVADDCSKDGTVGIAKEFQARYPGVIRVLERARNMGTQRNYYDAFENSRGKYIAWLDADDFWTDPNKLQAQVNLLEGDPKVTMCIHYVRWVTREGEVQRERFPSLPPGRYGLREVLKSNFLPSPSLVFRNGLHRNLPAWYFDVAPVTDWPLHVVAAMAGDVVLLDRVMADYTLNPTSSMWGQGDLFWYQSDAMFYERVHSIVPPGYRRQVYAAKGKRYEEIAYFLRKRGDFRGSRKAALKAFRAPMLLDNLGSKTKTLVASVVREVQWRLRRERAMHSEQTASGLQRP